MCVFSNETTFNRTEHVKNEFHFLFIYEARGIIGCLLGYVGMWKTSHTNKTMVFPVLALYESKPVTSISIAFTFLLVQRTTILGDAATDFNAWALDEWRTPGVKSSSKAWLEIVLANVKCMSTL